MAMDSIRFIPKIPFISGHFFYKEDQGALYPEPKTPLKLKKMIGR